MTNSTELRAIALTEFATSGYVSTSIARIAELAGVSKSNVLYHYPSKELLLEAVAEPAIAELSHILEATEKAPLDREHRRAFILRFVDFLLAHRLEVSLFLNQAGVLEDVPVMARADETVKRLANAFATTITTTEAKVRCGIALGGAAYLLVAGARPNMDDSPADEIKAALITILTQLLDPITD